jgi:hypothetical protein
MLNIVKLDTFIDTRDCLQYLVCWGTKPLRQLVDHLLDETESETSGHSDSREYIHQLGNIMWEKVVDLDNCLKELAEQDKLRKH